MVKTSQRRVLFKHTLSAIGKGVFVVPAMFMLIASVITVFAIARAPRVQAASAKTLNFQARLLTSAGAIVPDGYYNIEFKLYDAATSAGSSQGSCTGDANCMWTETRYDSNGVTAGNDNRVQVKAGYVSVYLGDVTDLPSNIWTKQLWLTMNIGGSNQTATPTYDGEMSPRLRLTAVPVAYSLTNYNSVTGYSSSLSLSGATGGDQSFTIPDQGAAGSYTLLTTQAANGSYIQNQTASDQTADFRISGTGRANTALQAPLIDTATAVALAVGTTNATAINLNQNTTVASTKSLTVTAGATSLTGLAAGSSTALSVHTGAANNKGIVVRGAASQSANLLEVLDDSNNVLTSIDSTGQANFYGTNTDARVKIDGQNGTISLGSGSSSADVYVSRAAANTMLVQGNLRVDAANASAVGLRVTAAGSQTGDLLQLRDNAGNVNSAFNATGNQLTLGRIAASGTVTQGMLVLSDGTTSNFGATLQSNTLTANRTFKFPDTALATTASPGTICVYNGTSSNCPAATGSAFYLWNSTTVQDEANFYLRSAATGSVVGVLEGENGQTADLLRFNTFDGSTSTTVARFTAAGNLQVAASVDTNTATGLSIGTSNANAITLGHTGITTTNAGALTVSELLTGNLGATISGATINLNASSNFATNINTGTSTGAVNIQSGTGTGAVTIGNGAAGNIALTSGGTISLTGTTTINTTGTAATSIGNPTGNLTLQGGSTVSLASSNGTNSTTLGFTGVQAAGDITYTLDRTVAAGSYGVCTTLASSCGGASGPYVALQGSFPGTQQSGTVSVANVVASYMQTNATIANTAGAAGIFLSGLAQSSTNNQNGILSNLTVDPGAASTQTYSSVNGYLYSGSSNTTNATLQGVVGYVQYDGTGTLNWSTGGSFKSHNSNSGTFTNANGASFQVTNTGAGTITNARGIDVQAASNSGGGSIGTNYGIYVASQTAGTTDYGVYIQGADTNALYVNSGNTYLGGGLTAVGTADINTTGTAATSIGNPTGNLVLQGGSTVSLASSNGTNSTTLGFTGAQPAGNITYNLDRAVTAGTYTICTTASGSCAGSYIQNQNAAQQSSSNFWISGTGRADTSLLSPTVDVATAGTLSIGNTTATAITLGHTGITTTNAGALTVSELLTGNLGATISGATINLNASSNFATNINTGTSTGAVSIGNSAAGAISLQSGSTVSLTGTAITLDGPVTVTANQSLRITGGNTASRPASPTEGMVYYDTTTKQLLTYANGKWQADRTDAIIVAASNSSQADKDAADYVADGNTGAAGDGDQVQINAALTAAAGKKVVLLAGTYTADATILVPNNTTMAGVGQGTLIQLADIDATDNLIENSDTTTGTGVAIRDLQIDGQQSLQTGTITQYGIYLFHMGSQSAGRAGARVSNVYIKDVRDTGVYLDSSENNVVTGSTLYSIDAGGSAPSGIYNDGSANNSFTNNTFLANYWGLRLDGSGTRNTTVTGNVFRGSTNKALFQFGAVQSAITGNTFDSNTDALILYTSGDSTVSGNTFYANTGYSITLDDSSGNTIAGNRIQNSGSTTDNNAIYIQNNSDSNIITGNAVTDSSATVTNYAIRIASAGSDTNYLSGNTLGGATINDSGTGTIYSGQIDSSGYIQFKGMTGTNIQGTTTINTTGTATTTIGNTTGNLVLQGGSTTTLSSSNGTNSTTLGFTGVQPAGNVTYSLDRAVTAGSYTICTSAGGSCTGSFIQNQNASAQTTANFWISGSGRMDGGLTVSGGTISLNASSNFATNINTGTSTGAVSIGNNSNTNNTVTIDAGATNGIVLDAKTTVNDDLIVNNGRLQITGTNTATAHGIYMNGTINSSATGSQYGIYNQPNFNPSGASLSNVWGTSNVPNISGSALNITQVAGTQTGISTGAGYTGQIGTGIALQVSAPTISGSQKIPDYRGISISGNSANTGNTSGTIENYQIYLNGNSAAAGASGTLNNYGIRLGLGSGNTSGTNNYGLYIQGNGGASASSNYAIYSSSTAASLLSGAFSTSGGIVNLNVSSNYATNINTGTSTGAVTIGNNSNVNNAVTIDAGNTGGINIGNSAAAHTVNVAAGGGANNQTVNIGTGVTGGSNASTITVGSANAAGSTTTLQGGNGAGAISLQAAASGTITVGTTNGNAITLGTSSSSTTNAGTFNVGASAGTGAFVNNGTTLNTTTTQSTGTNTSVSNINAYTSFVLTATAGSLSYTLPDPSPATAGKIVYISNASSGSNTFTLAPTNGTSILLNTGATATMLWNGTRWTYAGTDTSSLQNAYNNSTGGTTPEVLLDNTRNAFDIQDANSTLGASTPLFAVRGSATASTLGSALFTVTNNANAPLVGIGTNVASRALHVDVTNSTVNALPLLVQQHGTGDAGIELKNQTSSWYIGADNSDNGAFKITSSLATGSSSILGNSTVGTTDDSTDNNVINAGRYTASASGSVTSLSVYVACTISGSPNNQFRMALLTNSAGTPGNLMVESAAQTLVTGWNTVNVTPTAITSGATYWIAYNTNGTSGTHNCFRKNTSGGALYWSTAYTFGAMPASWPGSGGNDASNPSFYANVESSTANDSMSVQLFGLSTTGAATFQNSADSSAAFRIQNAAGATLANVDTSNSNVTLTSTSTSSTLLNVTNNSAATNTVSAITTNALTTGQALSITSTSTGITSGSLLHVSTATTGAVATNGIVSLNATGNYTSTSNAGLLNVAANSTAAGTITNVSGNALTTGVGVNIGSTGTGLTTGSLLKITSATTGAVATNGIVAIQATGNYTSTSNIGALTVQANSTTAGTIQRVEGNALTTGVGLSIASTGTGLTTGSLLAVSSATTGAVATNGIVNFTASGNYTSTSNVGLLNAVANATTAGTIVNISGTSLTTGVALNIAANNGTAIKTAGNYVFATGANRTMSVEANTSNAAGYNLTISSGAAGTGAAAFSGGTLTLQGGAAAGTGNANGGNVSITGGAGVGTGVKGLVVIDTPTFSTASNQNCAAADCTITQANVDGNGAVLVSFTSTGFEAAMPDPNQTTAGRIVYVTAAVGSSDFTLCLNDVAANAAYDGTCNTTAGNSIAMRANTTATLVWNGTDWTAAGASSSTDLQAAYNNTLTSAGGAELVLNASGGAADGLTIRNNGTTPISGGLLEVQTSIGTNLFSVNSYGTELASNGGAETAGGSPTTFPASTWSAQTGTGTPTVSRTVTSGQYQTGQAGVAVATTNVNQGVKNQLTGNPVTGGITYTVSFTAASSTAGSGTTPIEVIYSPDNGSTLTNTCQGFGDGFTTSRTISNYTSYNWTKVTCTVTTTATAVTTPLLIIRQTDATARTIYIDNLSFIRNDSTTRPSNVQVGGGNTGGQVTLFTFDRSSTAPLVSGADDRYLGSMYYDTTLGSLQCYESDGWGACGSAPDNIVSFTPEYTGAVLNGTGVGTMTADFCGNGGGLSVNTSFCASGEARNYYKWTSPQATSQSYSIYVTYRLPSTFKSFVAGTTSLTGLSDDTGNAGMSYGIYRKASGGGLTNCSADTTVVGWNGSSGVGSNNTWTTGTAGTLGGTTDPSTCTSFVAGDSVIFKITLNARTTDSAYVENLTFRYSNK